MNSDSHKNVYVFLVFLYCYLHLRTASTLFHRSLSNCGCLSSVSRNNDNIVLSLSLSLSYHPPSFLYLESSPFPAFSRTLSIIFVFSESEYRDVFRSDVDRPHFVRAISHSRVAGCHVKECLRIRQSGRRGICSQFSSFLRVSCCTLYSTY